MATISLSFTFKNKAFSLCATVKGTTKRNYREVKGLVNPNFDSWDKKLQQFNEETKEAAYNNKVLKDLLSRHQRLIEIYSPETGCELFSLFDNGSVSPYTIKTNKVTLRSYIEGLIYEMKHEHVKVPSKNYQVYISLLHKLEMEGSILNVKLEDINDIHFEKFGKFISYHLNGVNYLGLMKRFKVVVNKAIKLGIIKNRLTYPHLEFAPVKSSDFDDVINRGSVLSEDEYAEFVKMDLSDVYTGNGKYADLKELYRDFCIFMYEMKIRPCDAIRVKYTDIYNSDILSMPNKKKMNYIDKRLSFQTARLTPKAKSIIRKYKGQSTAGYIFPFSMNNYEWDLYNATSFNKWNNRKQATLQNVNEFLAKVKKILKVKQLTLYTFRHSAFTHEIKANKKSLMQIAKEGGTSVSMLEKHYFNHMC